MSDGKPLLINVALVVFGCLLNAGAQIALKWSVKDGGALGVDGLLRTLPTLVTNPWFIGSLALYGLSVINWMVVLSRMEVSVAYPMASLGYLVTFLFGVLLFHEGVSLTRILGLVVIIIGVVLISRPVPSTP